MDKRNFNEISVSRKLAISAVVIATYVVVMFLTSSFSFGAVQLRIATDLYSLSYVFPFLVLPMGLANLTSNMLMGGLGVYDLVGGFFVGVITSGLVYLIRKYNLSRYLIALPIIFGPGLLVPIWLSQILNVPYWTLALSLCLGQVIPGIVGVILVNYLERTKR